MKLILVLLAAFYTSKVMSIDIEKFSFRDSNLGIRADSKKLFDLPIINTPSPKGDKIVTLNRTGYMKVELDEFSKQFIEDSKGAENPVLELGAAYGITSLKALDNGATVIANDISKEHLAVIYNHVPEKYRSKLYLNNDTFPLNTNFPENSLSGVLLCRMAHFLKGDEIEEGIEKIYKWLAPGGKLYFVSLSPYHHLLKEKFLPVYNKKLESGEKWPGIINNMQEYNQKEKEDIPNFLHVFDTAIMSKFLEEKGFKIEKIKLFDYSNLSSDNKGYLGFVAVKDK